MAGLENARRGEGRGEVKGEPWIDLVREKDCGINPWGARGLTPRRGDEDTGVPTRGICHGAGDGRRRFVCRIAGGELAFAALSRYRHNTSSTAFSKIVPVIVVSFLSKSSNLSVLSSSSRVASSRMGRHIS